MSTETFLRLPEEKRNRFLEAAWEEFTTVPVDKVSVNKIILRANISRGSFYQYFSDKQDLMAYLLNQVRNEVVAALRQLSEESGGDFFAMCLRAFDQFSDQSGQGAAPCLDRWVKLIRVNPGANLESLFYNYGDNQLRRAYLDCIDLTTLRVESEDFAVGMGELIGMSIAGALAETLHDGTCREKCRRGLETKLSIIQKGCLRESAHIMEGVVA